MKCYAIENHPNDSRATMDPRGIVQTLSSWMGTGGNNTPFVLITSSKTDSQYGKNLPSQPSVPPAVHSDMEEKDLLCFAVDSHPMDSRMRLEGETFPTITTNIRKAGCDGPLVLIRGMI